VRGRELFGPDRLLFTIRFFDSNMEWSEDIF